MAATWFNYKSIDFLTRQSNTSINQIKKNSDHIASLTSTLRYQARLIMDLKPKNTVDVDEVITPYSDIEVFLGYSINVFKNLTSYTPELEWNYIIKGTCYEVACKIKFPDENRARSHAKDLIQNLLIK
jgi:hypothetical protein